LDYEVFSSDILLNINLEKSYGYNAHLSGEDLIDLFRQSKIDLSCPYCKRKNQLKSKQDLIKLPEILIINIENSIYKKIPINLKVDEIIKIKSYMSSELYELFAINRNIGNNKHYICQVKKNEKWYEINDVCCCLINYVISRLYVWWA
jgi:ubiquitin C-terminal hydrolase